MTNLVAAWFNSLCRLESRGTISGDIVGSHGLSERDSSVKRASG